MSDILLHEVKDKTEIITATKPAWKQPPSGSASAKIAKFVCDF